MSICGLQQGIQFNVALLRFSAEPFTQRGELLAYLVFPVVLGKVPICIADRYSVRVAQLLGYNV
jgi:hypothetical protein